MTEEEKQAKKLITENICRRMCIGAMSQLLVEQLDNMEVADPIWRNRLKQSAVRFKKELDKELDMQLALPDLQETTLKLTNVIEDELKDIYTHVEEQVINIVKNEEDKSK